jgi:serine/threonine protein kinase
VSLLSIQVGSLFDDKFEIVSEIGHGGMGRVYKAVQKSLDRTVALKIISEANVDAVARGRMEREAIALSELKHEAILSVYGYGVSELGPYLVLEFVDGITLQDKLSDGPLPVALVLDLILQLADGLAYAHRQGIIHRDLKPENVMITDSANGDGPQVKLIDLGLARLTPESGRSQQKLTKTGFMVGTSHYMSPEECLGGSADQRSDIYSMGLILYECLTGRSPYGDKAGLSVLYAHLNEEPALLCFSMGADEPPGLQSVISRLLAKNPNDRYQTVDEFIEDLKLVRNGRGGELSSPLNSSPQVHAANAAVPKRSKSNKTRLLISLTAIGVTASCALVPAGLTYLKSHTDKPQQTSLEMYNSVIRRFRLNGRTAAPADVEFCAQVLERDKIDRQLSARHRFDLLTQYILSSTDYEVSRKYVQDALSIAAAERIADPNVCAVADSYAWLIHHSLGGARRNNCIAALEKVLSAPYLDEVEIQHRDEVRYHLARLYFGAGDKKRAAQMARDYCNRPQSLPFLRNQMMAVLAPSLVTQGKYDEAVALFGDGSNIPDSINNEDRGYCRGSLALAYLGKGRVADAAACLDETTCLNEDTMSAQMLLAAREKNWKFARKRYNGLCKKLQAAPTQYYALMVDYALPIYESNLEAAGFSKEAAAVKEVNAKMLSEFKLTLSD